METAAAHPEVLLWRWRVADRLLLAMEKVMARGLDNVVFVCDDAARLGRCLPHGEVGPDVHQLLRPLAQQSTPNGG